MGSPNENVTTVEQIVYPVPDIPIKDLLGAIPYVVFMPGSTFAILNKCSSLLRAHCFKRSALRSSSYLWAASLDSESLAHSFYRVWDAFVIWCFYKVTTYLDNLIDTPDFFLYFFLKIALWSLYGFWAGLFATGLWVIGHECGHQSFSESKTINNTVGWIVHSACVLFLALKLFFGDVTHVWV